MFDQTSICLVAIKNPPISAKIGRFIKATKQVLVGLPIWTQEVKQQLYLYNLGIDHVTIQLQVIYLLGAKVGAIAVHNHGPGMTRAKHRRLISCPGSNTTKTGGVESLAGSGMEPNVTTSQNPDHWQVTWTRCQHYL